MGCRRVDGPSVSRQAGRWKDQTVVRLRPRDCARAWINVRAHSAAMRDRSLSPSSTCHVPFGSAESVVGEKSATLGFGARAGRCVGAHQVGDPSPPRRSGVVDRHLWAWTPTD